MATFYNQPYNRVDTAQTTAVTSSSNSTIVLSILVSNRDGTATQDITCAQLNSSNAVDAYVAYTVPVPNDSTVELLGNKLILPSGKKIAFLASTSGTLDAIVSYVEV